jgi:allophanate hydrolase
VTRVAEPAHYHDDLGSLQLDELRTYYASPGRDPATMIRALLERIDAQKSANVWIAIQGEDVLYAAAASLSRRWPDPSSRPPLWGVPIAVKDNVDVLGLPTTAGCPDFAYQPAESAELVKRLLAAGALVVGKTNMDQFASGLTGARSAYGICRSPFDPAYIGGGSSSGSALAVSLGLAAAAIGTDTAGSGRVPAAFTNTVGLKPSRGLVSTRGIVPACRSLDCASVFALSVSDASAVLAVIAGADPDDPWSRPLPVPPAQPVEPPVRLRIGFCNLTADGVDSSVAASYETAIAALTAIGADLVPVDIGAFRSAGDLLYDGPWVAERLTELESWVDAHPSSLLPVTATVLAGARQKSAATAFRGFHRLAELSMRIAPVWDTIDALVLPTVPESPTVADTLADPHQMNTRMGTYTMFCNLLDLAGLALPVTLDESSGRPAGVSIYAPAGRDRDLIAIGARLQQLSPLPAGATPFAVRPPVRREPTARPSESLLLAVVGAHRSGQPLHQQLLDLAAVPVTVTVTAASYRLYALASSPDDPVRRPGMVRVNEAGASIEVETLRIPKAAIGDLLASIPPPLGLGTVDLVDGTRAIGFLCESAGTETAADITDFTSWPNYLASIPAGRPPHRGEHQLARGVD